ncbi:MAG: hypothetical protein BMS9Abin37_1260 [Acidobacteriota bacterium]|nr:MAG: hypothetical protein BMS9Abin37_1260 [Acidobacteriota bacterium]
MALSGTLKDFALPDIFQLIGMQRKTGLLTLESERETVSVVFEQGMVVHADSTVRRLDDLLGNVLVRQGKMRKEILEEALAKQKVSMQRLGFILTSQGYIERGDLTSALSEQVQQIVFRVFRWKSGNYHFDPAADTDYDRDNASPVSTDHILMEGIRRVDEWPIIEKRIPTLDSVFRPLVPQKQIKVEEEADDSGGLEAAFGDVEGDVDDSDRATSEVVLDTQEAKIYKLVDGERSVTTIMEMTGLSDFDVCRTLFDFLDRNLVAPATQERARSRRQAGPRVEDGAPNQVVGLVGLVVVLALSAVGFAVSMGAPFRVPALPSFLLQESETIQRSRDVAGMQRIVSALRAYYMAFDTYPAALDDLVNATPPLVSADDLRGAGGEPYRYQTSPERVVLQAIGPSGEPYLSVVREILPEEVTLPGPPSIGSSGPE